ncbi:plasma membrane localization protein [Thecaphora frezii]
MCFPKSNHKKLVDECYPVPKALATSGPEFRPNSNELSRLAYYGNNKPAKLAKVGGVLENRAAADARATKGSGAAADKGKTGLMITLSITRELLTECKAHLNYFIRPAQAVIKAALDAAAANQHRPRDLEISARAASTFYALASYVDPAATSVDSGFKELLKAFSGLAVERPRAAGDVNQTGAEDAEQRNRTRLIGIGALGGAIGSDVLYTASFPDYSAFIVPALLENMKDNRVTLDWLKSESAKVSDGRTTFMELSVKKKPLAARRAPSLSGHVAGEKGPQTEDVVTRAIAAMQGLLRHGDATHVQAVVSHAILWLDAQSALPIPAPIDGRNVKSHWENHEWCGWLAQSLCSWTALQYRFVVLTALVEHLVDVCDGQATTKHLSLIEMAKDILTGQLSLIGLSTSDTLSSLAALAVRRVYRDTRDSLLPPLVDCVSGLGTHIYYAEQINDIADELSARIAALQMPAASAEAAGVGSIGSTRGGNIKEHLERQRLANAGPEQRDESIRVLLFILMGVLRAAHRSSGEVQKDIDENAAEDDKGKTAATGAALQFGLARARTRNRVSLSVMLPTASLLTSSNYGVRLAYIQTLVTLFRDEIDRERIDGAAAGIDAALSADTVEESIGFIHALAASIHVMSLSKTLATNQAITNALRESPLELVPQIERINFDSGRPGSLQADVPAAGQGPSAEAAAALPIDYVALAQALEELITAAPSAAALGLVPMLLALDRDAGSRLVVDGLSTLPNTGLENQRRIAARLVSARALAKLGETLDVPSIVSSAQSVLSQIPPLGVELGPTPPETLTLPPEVVPFSVVPGINGAGESSSTGSPSVDRSTVINGLASSTRLQTSSRLDVAAIRKWLERDWSVTIAVDEAFAGSLPGGSGGAAGGKLAVTYTRRSSHTPPGGISGNATPAANGYGFAANSSTASKSSADGMPESRSVGVDDFREALRVNGNDDGKLGAGNGLAGRRASRRESRKISTTASQAPMLGSLGLDGSNAVSLLDSLNIGVGGDPKGEPSSLQASMPGSLPTKPLLPPYAA